MSNIISSYVACMAADLHLYFLFTTGIAVLFHELRESTFIFFFRNLNGLIWINQLQRYDLCVVQFVHILIPYMYSMVRLENYFRVQLWVMSRRIISIIN
jgi:hypothetical protein